MNFTTKNIVTLIAVIALVAALSPQSEAGGCHSSGRGHSHGGFSVSISRPTHNNYRPQYQQPQYRQPTYQQPIAVPQQPISQQGQPFGQPQQQTQQGQPFAGGQPQQQGQQQPAQAPQQQAQQQPAAATKAPTASAVNAETSALEALGGFAPPQAESDKPVAETATLPVHVGRWSATLSNGARIQLDLNANGSFSWSAANKDGASSSFEGTYEINNGSLTLIRSTDNQKLAGSLETSTNDAFSFQLADQKSAKLEFVRA